MPPTESPSQNFSQKASVCTSSRQVKRTPLWNVQNEGMSARVNAPAMLLDWAVIGIITGGAILLFKKRKE